MKIQVKFFTLVFSVLLLFSCKEKQSYSKLKNSQIPVKDRIHEIVVNEFKNAGTYTYVSVTEESNMYWIAIPNTKVIVGATYYYTGGVLMKDFESKQLKKTFEYVTFVEGIRTTEKISATKDEKKHSHINTPEIIKIDLPENGTSLNKLFSEKESFSNKVIIVKGKVVKVNNGIMNRNWVHISDGTQFEGIKSLTITTLEMVKVGDIVTFEGTIILNKDFGQGYLYEILMEESKLIN
ncbi:hypothetical protein JYT50_00715 [bacterium AH-315-A23]|nr:hypothetical protein [bacterium AH-315-A23]PHS52988.1 MAG: hypothetical protein COB01_05385 [Lutibacter sp.]